MVELFPLDHISWAQFCSRLRELWMVWRSQLPHFLLVLEQLSSCSTQASMLLCWLTKWRGTVPLHGWLTLAGLEAGIWGTLHGHYWKTLLKRFLDACLSFSCIPVTSSVVKCYMHKVITSNSVAVFHTEATVSGREWSLNTHGESLMLFMMGLCWKLSMNWLPYSTWLFQPRSKVYQLKCYILRTW